MDRPRMIFEGLMDSVDGGSLKAKHLAYDVMYKQSRKYRHYKVKIIFTDDLLTKHMLEGICKT